MVPPSSESLPSAAPSTVHHFVATPKKNRRTTPDGLQLHSFSTLMHALATRCRHQCRLRDDADGPTEVATVSWTVRSAVGAAARWAPPSAARPATRATPCPSSRPRENSRPWSSASCAADRTLSIPARRSTKPASGASAWPASRRPRSPLATASSNGLSSIPGLTPETSLEIPSQPRAKPGCFRSGLLLRRRRNCARQYLGVTQESMWDSQTELVLDKRVPSRKWGAACTSATRTARRLADR